MFRFIYALCFGFCYLLSSYSQAGIIEFNGYSRDESSKFIKGQGLEWLRWDQANGMSINEGLAKFSSQGWRLASNKEMAILFDAFNFGELSWVLQEHQSQRLRLSWSNTTFDPLDNFLQLFGFTALSSCSISGVSTGCYVDYDPYAVSKVLFGNDQNQNSMFNMAEVLSDASLSNNGSTTTQDGFVAFYADIFSKNYSKASLALVRDAAPVSLPTTVTLFLLSLTILFFTCRHRLIAKANR
ncbi:hypothetical protein ABGI61_08405 [Rheinheimera sp. FR7-31]|uniref:hypothetical protein n=1 Tax=Rheinheimera fenheensis TaxID=3152295 RepID=UPI00325ED483